MSSSRGREGWEGLREGGEGRREGGGKGWVPRGKENCPPATRRSSAPQPRPLRLHQASTSSIGSTSYASTPAATSNSSTLSSSSATFYTSNNQQALHTSTSTETTKSKEGASSATALRDELPHPSVTSLPTPLPATYQEELPAELPSMFRFPPPLAALEEPVTCVVEQEGHLSLRLRAGVTLAVSPGLAILLRNPRHHTALALSPCSSHLALVHPMARLLQYGPRIEVQVDDDISVKNAKIHPKGVSFTANNCALVYLLDEAGARSTSDMFHDLQASDIAATLFQEAARGGGWAVAAAVEMLEGVQYWRDEEEHWVVGGVLVTQTRDGLVTVDRPLGGDSLRLRVSPNNGKVRYERRGVVVTASTGEERHLFLRAGDRRLHYSGQVSQHSLVS